MRGRTFAIGAALGAVMLAALALQLAGYWPGLMLWDAIRQYGEALDGSYDDWHPPAMDWLWRQLGLFGAGPAPMLALQLALYWGGYALIAARALARGRRALAVGIVACALLPIPLALMGAVLKDCLMAGALLAVTGMLAWSDRARALRIPAIALLIAVATIRFNAFLAELPLLVALLPAAWRRTPARLAIVCVLAAVPLAVALPIANRLLDAEPSGVELSLVIFDLGGITLHSGVDAFPPLPGVADPVAVNARCYSPVKWDPYSYWVETPCPITFENVRAALAARGQHAYPYWLRAILAHPVAYAAHRLTHFNINSRFLIRDVDERPVFDHDNPNPWNYALGPSRARDALDALALASAATPLGWPIWWMALALGALILARRLPDRGLVVPLALSSLLYGLGYLVLSVAAEMRYHLWTMIAAALAAVIAAAEVRGAAVSRGRLLLAGTPLVLVTVLCAVWRLI